VNEPVWLLKEAIMALHDQLLADFGGAAGLRDEALLESALARPANLFAYGKPSLFDLAAAYAFGIVGNHPFIDGNKRTSFMAAYVFLARNGYCLSASEAEATAATLALAAKETTEAEYARWLDANCRQGILPHTGCTIVQTELGKVKLKLLMVSVLRTFTPC
jgi:death-on-curing protein